MKKTYITTPLYYVNDVPHIGHAYTTVAADVLSRWHRARGRSVHFLTGTDEHGAKIAQAAAAAGKTPLAYADHIVTAFQTLWSRLGITHDDFIRTTEPRHTQVVQYIFERLLKQGDIYLGTYEDWYCVSCETFWSETDLTDQKCPTCGRTVERLKEESYFFKLSAYEKPLLDYFEKHPGFLQPKHRAPEILSFVRGGLKDLSVSRTKVSWGVPVPGHAPHTVYVWFDALINYISAVGYGAAPTPLFAETWPAQVHLVGKEIYRFHTVIWPAILMGLGLPLPTRVFAHGWWTVEGDKMSKSKGNVVDPHRVADEYGVDALRYFLLREVPFGSDGDFSHASLRNRYNSELANALGNLLNRVLTLVEKNFDGVLAERGTEVLVPTSCSAWVSELDGLFDALAFHEVLDKIFNLVNRANKYAEETAPWKLVKTDRAAAHGVLTEMARALKVASAALASFMPSVAVDMMGRLGHADPAVAITDVLQKGSVRFAPGQKIVKGEPLFPRKETPA